MAGLWLLWVVVVLVVVEAHGKAEHPLIEEALAGTMNNNTSLMEALVNTEYQRNMRSYDFGLTVTNNKMAEEEKHFALDKARLAIVKYHKVKTSMAAYIREEFDKKYGKYWTCIIGNDYASSTSHDRNHYIYFKMGDLHFNLFKNGC